jgi:LmbE family N-acetylglucosaminyl deacetylase
LKYHWDKNLKTMVDENRQPMFSEKELKAWKPEAPTLMQDIGEFVSPIDDVLISSRSQLREYEKSRHVYQVGRDLDIMGQADKRHKAALAAAADTPTTWVDPV